MHLQTNLRPLHFRLRGCMLSCVESILQRDVVTPWLGHPGDQHRVLFGGSQVRILAEEMVIRNFHDYVQYLRNTDSLTELSPS
jgi:hypothetical protein